LSLDITISSRHADLPDALVATTRQKIARLSRFGSGIERAEVHFYEERNPRIADREVCEVWMDGHGRQVRCKVAGPDGFVAVDRAVEKLEHQLHKLKTRTTLR
jgi:putative sigma-54 modulation protein